MPTAFDPDLALLLIAHGSRHAEANADLDWLALELKKDGVYRTVVATFLELAAPTIEEGGKRCVEAGAKKVLLVPYFLSAGVHVRRDLEDHRCKLAAAHPGVSFSLAEPLGRHPLLVEVVRERVRQTLARRASE